VDFGKAPEERMRSTGGSNLEKTILIAGQFDPEGISRGRNIHTRGTPVISSSVSAKGRTGGVDDLKRGGRWKSPHLQVEAVV
jgi:hypothetical protein